MKFEFEFEMQVANAKPNQVTSSILLKGFTRETDEVLLSSVVEACARIVEIPVFGFKHSLNVACACAVTVYEILRQWEVPE